MDTQQSTDLDLDVEQEFSPFMIAAHGNLRWVVDDSVNGVGIIDFAAAPTSVVVTSLSDSHASAPVPIVPGTLVPGVPGAEAVSVPGVPGVPGARATSTAPTLISETHATSAVTTVADAAIGVLGALHVRRQIMILPFVPGIGEELRRIANQYQVQTQAN